MSWLGGMLERLRAVVRSADEDAETAEELRYHLDREAERLERSGVEAGDARRRAAILLGGVDKHREQVRDARGFAWLPGLALDTRLGMRMLVKYPGLTLVGGAGMAVAIALGAIAGVTASAIYSELPFAEAERVVAIEVWDAEVNNQERRILHDFFAWQSGLRTVGELGAWRTVQHNIGTEGRAVTPTPVAEMSPSGFDLTRTAPVLGRTLVDEDARADATPVVVIGYDEWQARFDGARDIIGRELRIGGRIHTIVGVMPEGFAFPIDHAYWVPLVIDAAAEPREGSGIRVFGRLAPGVAMQTAQAELTAVGERMAAAFPATHELLRPRVMPYTTQMYDDMQGWETRALRLLVILLLVLVCANVAILVYARTATRTGEMLVRTALGASRFRIVTQLFAEALVLSALAAAAGLALASFAIRRADAALAPIGAIPFWVDISITRGTMLFVLALMVTGAFITGVVPALRATGVRLQSGLRQLGGGTGMLLGRTWTVLIVAQVAIAVAVLPAAIYWGSEWLRHGLRDAGVPGSYLTATVVLQADDTAAHSEREIRQRVLLAARIGAQPAVVGLTFAADLPGQEPTVVVELEGGDTIGPTPRHDVRSARVDAAFFSTFDVPVVTGRDFIAGDVGSAQNPVIVNRSFVNAYLAGASAPGTRLRYAQGFRSGGVERMPQGVSADEWYEIVGVVEDFPLHEAEPRAVSARVYHMHDGTLPARMIVRGASGSSVAGVTALTQAVRTTAAQMDASLQLRDVLSLQDAMGAGRTGMRFGALAIGLVAGCVLLLSAAGIYALMSFTVTRRRREIGIRSALGADPRRILFGIFARAGRQVGIGAFTGAAAAAALDAILGGALRGVVFVPVVAVLMMLTGVLATLGPARRALQVQPSEALGSDA